MQNNTCPLLWDIITAHKALKDRTISSRELTKIYLDNAKTKNKDTGAYITICEQQALKDADKADQMLKDDKETNLLCGIPYAVKDNICTKDIKTTCASDALKSFIPTYDAFAITQLKNRGAVLLGKTNMDEFAMGSDGKSSYFGHTKNPNNLLYSAGGSSSGSAAAVASNCAIFSLGSDTGGSVRQPASFCGVCGISPTYGSVSRNGLIAFSSSLDTIGVVTKNAYDSAVVLNNICMKDIYDHTSVGNIKDFTSECEKSIKGLKIGIAKELFPKEVSDDVKRNCLDAIQKLCDMGAEICEISFPSYDLCSCAYSVISCCEAFSNLSRYDGIRYAGNMQEWDSISQLYTDFRTSAFGSRVKKRIMFGSLCLNTDYYTKALKAKEIIKKDLLSCFEKCDIIACPTSPTTAQRLDFESDSVFSDMLTVCVNLCDTCAVSINCGYDKNSLPIGLQLIAKPFDEKTLYRAAVAFEETK